jgi:hypothetical protein
MQHFAETQKPVVGYNPIQSNPFHSGLAEGIASGEMENL